MSESFEFGLIEAVVGTPAEVRVTSAERGDVSGLGPDRIVEDLSGGIPRRSEFLRVFSEKFISPDESPTRRRNCSP